MSLMLVDLFLATSFVLFIETIARLPPSFSQSFVLFFHLCGGQSTGLLPRENDLQSKFLIPRNISNKMTVSSIILIQYKIQRALLFSLTQLTKTNLMCFYRG